jgi:hypothetical protein
MLKVVDSASNFIRAVVSLILIVSVGVGMWTGYQLYSARERAMHAKDDAIAAKEAELVKHRAQIVSLNEDLAAKQRQIERLDMAMRLLKTDHRLARIEVLEQTEPADGKPQQTRFSFVEMDDAGNALDRPQEFQIDGDVAHIDALVVSFDDTYVEQGDPLRGTSLALFRRVYGDDQKPSEGFPLDTVGGRPAAYSRGHQPSELESEIWSKFWDYANDPELASKAGVRTAHGKDAYIQLRKGMRYRVQLRKTGDLTIQPEEPSGGDKARL